VLSRVLRFLCRPVGYRPDPSLHEHAFIEVGISFDDLLNCLGAFRLKNSQSSGTLSEEICRTQLAIFKETA
jgi:hypothetical protein